MKTHLITVDPEIHSGTPVFAGTRVPVKTGKAARISFASPELLRKVLTAKRWELLKALCGAGPISIREAACRVNRDVKAVHGDVSALLGAGVLDRSESGGNIPVRGCQGGLPVSGRMNAAMDRRLLSRPRSSTSSLR